MFSQAQFYLVSSIAVELSYLTSKDEPVDKTHKIDFKWSWFERHCDLYQNQEEDQYRLLLLTGSDPLKSLNTSTVKAILFKVNVHEY